MNKRPLYFDYAATTPVDERVIQVMIECLGFHGNFGNPASSSHAYGQQARQTVEQARRHRFILVPEPGRPGNGVVTGRYAIARFNLLAEGRPSHAGFSASQRATASTSVIWKLKAGL